MFFGYTNPEEYAKFIMSLYPIREADAFLRGQKTWAEHCFKHGANVDINTVTYLERAHWELIEHVQRTSK